MKFERITERILSNGECAKVYPFHVCTEGQSDKVIFRNDDDLRAGFNFFPICARKANVLVVADCVLSTHMHALILAKSYEDARKFGVEYKMTVSKYLSAKYGVNAGLFRRVDASPILIEDDYYLRNAICYVLRNALDMGFRIDKYPWSSYRALFCNGLIKRESKAVSLLSRREVRSLLKTGSDLKGTKWMIDADGVIEPASYCEYQYAEAAFKGDIGFFMKILGLTDDDQMYAALESNLRKTVSVEELLKILEERAGKRYGLAFGDLTLSQKIPLLKSTYHSVRTTVSQLARCSGIKKEDLEVILLKRS